MCFTQGLANSLVPVLGCFLVDCSDFFGMFTVFVTFKVESFRRGSEFSPEFLCIETLTFGTLGLGHRACNSVNETVQEARP